MHTVTMTYTVTLNVEMLITLSKGKLAVRRSLTKLDTGRLNRSRRTGFSRLRYKTADISYPILIDDQNVLLDGRHRLCKLYDLGRKYAYCIVMSDSEIMRCQIDGRKRKD